MDGGHAGVEERREEGAVEVVDCVDGCHCAGESEIGNEREIWRKRRTSYRLVRVRGGRGELGGSRLGRGLLGRPGWGSEDVWLA